jgi:hypothetical protein
MLKPQKLKLLHLVHQKNYWRPNKNQFGDGKTLDSNAMNQTFARKDGRSLLSAIERWQDSRLSTAKEAPPLQEAPTGSIERRRVVDPIGSVGNSDPEPTPPTPPDILDDVDPNMSEVDRLKEQYRMMESQRFIVDPGPEIGKDFKL